MYAMGVYTLQRMASRYEQTIAHLGRVAGVLTGPMHSAEYAPLDF